MVVTIDCRDTINCKVTIVLCNGGPAFPTYVVYLPENMPTISYSNNDNYNNVK